MEYSKGSYLETPEHDVTLPFTRMLAGPMDYTPGCFNNATKAQFKPRDVQPMCQGTRAHQVAMYAVFLSPLEMLADYPNRTTINPAWSFWRKRPPSGDQGGEWRARKIRHPGAPERQNLVPRSDDQLDDRFGDSVELPGVWDLRCRKFRWRRCRQRGHQLTGEQRFRRGIPCTFTLPRRGMRPSSPGKVKRKSVAIIGPGLDSSKEGAGPRCIVHAHLLSVGAGLTAGGTKRMNQRRPNSDERKARRATMSRRTFVGVAPAALCSAGRNWSYGRANGADTQHSAANGATLFSRFSTLPEKHCVRGWLLRYAQMNANGWVLKYAQDAMPSISGRYVHRTSNPKLGFQ